MEESPNPITPESADLPEAPCPQALAPALSKFKLFADLAQPELEALVHHSATVCYRAGGTIITQGEEGHCMYVLLAGKARVVVDGSPIATLHEGDFFGEISLVDDGPRAADVLAENDCQLLMITRMTLGVLAGIQPEAAIHLLAAIGRSLVAKLRADNQRFKDLILLGSREP